MSTNLKKITTKGLQFSRRYTKEGISPFEMFEYTTRCSSVHQSNGEVYQAAAIEVPAQWSQVATDKLVKNYFMQAQAAAGPEGMKAESVKEAAHQMAHRWREWGEQHGYFATQRDGQVFYEELAYSILSQNYVPNGSHWLNTCIKKQGVSEQKTGHQSVDKGSHRCKQPHACFLLGVMNKVMDFGNNPVSE